MAPPSKSAAIEFVVTSNIRRVNPRAGKTIVALRNTGWDDFRYRTSFEVYVSEHGAAFHPVGEWKIADTGHDAPPDAIAFTVLPSSFRLLEPRHVALAQDIENYEGLSRFTRPVARALLEGLRDVVFAPGTRKFEQHDAFTKSLKRFSGAQNAYLRGRDVLARLGIVSDQVRLEDESDVKFVFECQLPGFADRHKVDFCFSGAEQSLQLRRMFALVGRNGTGKTLLLGALARSLSGLDEEGTTTEPAPAFTKILAVSYSAWDDFVRPRGEGDRIPYVYCGLRSVNAEPGVDILLDVSRARLLAANDLSHLLVSSRVTMWREALKSCGLLRVGSPFERVRTRSGFLAALEKCSAGEQLVAIVLTRLLRHLRADALVLFDEPELHMHPGLLSAFLRTTHDLLEQFDAFAVVATHSPIPLQEIPSRSIRVVELVDAVPTVRGLDEQSFGASLGDIVGLAFGSRPDERNFASHLKRLIANGTTAEQIVAALGGEESLGVAMLLRALDGK